MTASVSQGQPVAHNRVPAEARAGVRLGRLSVGDALYLSSQVMPAFAGMVLLAIVMVQAVFRLLSGPKARAAGPIGTAGDLHPVKLAIVISLVGLIFIVQSMMLPHEVRAGTAIHLLIYLVVVFAHRSLIASWPSLQLVRWVVWVNTILLLTFFLDGAREVFWYENLGQYRFRSYYFEPSIAALMYVLNILIIWSSGRRSRDSMLLISMSLAGLLLTYSGSGILLLALIMMTGISWKQLAPVLKIVLIVIPLLILWSLTPQGAEAIDDLIVQRVVGIVALEYDNSVHLRAVAPFIFLADQLETATHALIGFGVGGLENHILTNESSLLYLTNFAGELMTSVNNGYVVLIALVGLPTAILCFAWLGVRVVSSPGPSGLKVYIVLYPFFSGFVIHPLIWLLVVMIGLRVARRRPLATTAVRHIP
ncbi:MAG: hypothetical protein WCS09_18530 [Pseudomonadota bacterium]